MVVMVSVTEVANGDEDVGGVGPACGSGEGTAKSRLRRSDGGGKAWLRSVPSGVCANVRSASGGGGCEQENARGIHVVFWSLPREGWISR
jgi:hypothetical protein